MTLITINHTQKTESEAFALLKEHYATTTQSANHFKAVIDSIAWDAVFAADGERYYCAGGFTLTIENANPFKQACVPTVLFSDGSMVPLA